MDKQLKYTLIGGIAVIALSIAYYLVIFIPNKQSIADSQKHADNKMKCQKETIEYIKKDEKSYPVGDYLVLDPVYVFSDELNTCLYKKQTEFFGGGKAITEDNYIIDIYTNKTIAHSYFHYDSEGKVNNSRGEEEYEEADKRYFGTD